MRRRGPVPEVGRSVGIRMCEYIAEGGFAQVFKARHERTGVYIAVKRLISTDSASVAILRKEISMQRKLDHPFIVHCYGTINEDGVDNVICDYVPGKSLLSFVHERCGLPEEVVRKFTVQLLCALRYLHSEKRVVHRDIKLENVVVEKEFVRLIDFGYSRVLDPQMATRCGSLPYSAPEILQEGKYSGEPVDVWSLGVVVYAMLAGQLPFSGEDVNELALRICNHPPAEIGRRVSPHALDFVTRMLTKDPRRRITTAQAMDHPFVRAADNRWLLESGALEGADFRCFLDAPDADIVARLVERGYDREAVRASTDDDIREEAPLAYELLRMAAIRRNLRQLVLARSWESPARAPANLNATISFIPLSDLDVARRVPESRRARAGESPPRSQAVLAKPSDEGSALSIRVRSRTPK